MVEATFIRINKRTHGMSQNMKATFTGNSSNPLKRADKTAKLKFDRKPDTLKIFNY